jgi:hypothetical protein
MEEDEVEEGELEAGELPEPSGKRLRVEQSGQTGSHSSYTHMPPR